MDIRIKTTLDYIEDNISLSFSLKSLAQVACLSPSQFHRIFKKETNKTPFQFIEEIKLTKAYQLLIIGNTTVQELTYSLGYNDYETFSRAFKKQYKLSPDDLKSISLKLQKDVENVREGQIIIASLEVDNETDMMSQLNDIMNEHDIPKEELKDARIFKIAKKSMDSHQTEVLVKNKYALSEDNKIWELLLK